MAAMAAAEENSSGAKYHTLHLCGSSMATVQPQVRRTARHSARRLRPLTLALHHSAYPRTPLTVRG
jgi:hypothetical protein